MTLPHMTVPYQNYIKNCTSLYDARITSIILDQSDHISSFSLAIAAEQETTSYCCYVAKNSRPPAIALQAVINQLGIDPAFLNRHIAYDALKLNLNQFCNKSRTPAESQIRPFTCKMISYVVISQKSIFAKSTPAGDSRDNFLASSIGNCCRGVLVLNGLHRVCTLNIVPFAAQGCHPCCA
ncbi:hypothetical protein VNO80_10684 [Phaseolus coccineus]|uniref:Uncharacterized protein n=1 Tax=Phaseolus coccineus TaxID=3886 RepID=A0AAN9N946_PHACN